MIFSVSRKWRQFFKRCSLRATFSLVLLLVVANMLVYVIGSRWRYMSYGTVGGTEGGTIGETTDGAVDGGWLEPGNDTGGTEIRGGRGGRGERSGKTRYREISKNKSLTKCPNQAPNLVGAFPPDFIEYHWHVIESKFPDVNQGHWSPNCQTKQKVAIIIPYRNREKHVKVLINNLHAFLRKQQQNYGIFIVEQMPGTSFNRAMLFNIGFKESLKWYDFNCFIFHDVDLIPENDLNFYRCTNNPIHMSAYIDKFSYKLPYQDLFGGVCAININQFRHVNGFSNFYFGWGGEDDDMSKRLRFHGFKIFRYPEKIGAYKMIRHHGDSGNAANTWRFALVKSAIRRMDQDGLNSLQYKLLGLKPSKLSVWLQVQVDEDRIKLNYSLWIKKDFFDADLNYQLKVVLVVFLLFVSSLIVMCFIIMCAIKATPDSQQPLLSNKLLISEKIHVTSR